MATLYENKERIKAAKQSIKQSIINKGVEINDTLKIEDYASKIDLIKQGPEEGTYSIEVYVRIDNELIGEGIKFNLVGTNGETISATSRAGGYVFVTLNYGVGYDMQPEEQDKYYAETHPLIYHLKDEGEYFATDYYFTTVQTSGGNDFKIDNLSYQFYQCANMEQFDNLIKIFSTQPTSLSYFGYLGASKLLQNSYKLFEFLNNLDLSKCEALDNSFYEIVLPKIQDEVMTINLNININSTKIKNFKYFLGSINRSYSPTSASHNNLIQKTKFIIDFNGTTGNVTDFSYHLRSSNVVIGTVEILNHNLDKATNTTATFNTMEGLTRLTFKGGFGALSSTSSLTLDLAKSNLLTAEAFLETLTTIDANESGKTRIFKLPAALYEVLTDEIWDLADEKLYDIASA